MPKVNLTVELPDDEHPIEEIARFMEQGGQTVPTRFNGRIDDWKDCLDIRGFIQEELNELTVGLVADDWAEILDAFVDTAFVALTGAIRVAGTEAAIEAWEAVVTANLSKVDGSLGEPMLLNGKIQKPKGWEAPDIEGILDGHKAD